MASDSVHTFDHNQNSCTIDFVGISFKDERNVRYQYRMLGHDSTWTKPTKEHSVTYASLRPGAYEFEVRAMNGDGVTSVRPAMISFIIVPPVWLRWWFVFGLALVLASIVYGLVRYRLYHLMKLERLRFRIARDLHDDVGTNLSSIMIASQIMERKLPLSETDRRQVSQLRATAGQTQELLRDIVWLMNPGNDSLGDFVLKLREIAARVLQGIPFVFRTSGEHEVEKIGLEFKRNIVSILKEALNNVVRHSRASAVDLEAVSSNGVFVLMIRDNGQGFDMSRVSGGNGLNNFRTRAESMGGTIEILSAPGNGTTVRLSVNITHMRSGRWSSDLLS
jgi:signal transduction histidine kinase